MEKQMEDAGPMNNDYRVYANHFTFNNIILKYGIYYKNFLQCSISFNVHQNENSLKGLL